MKVKNIVLLHGWGASTKKLGYLKKDLIKLGWNVFLPKFPGFDLPHPTSAWNLNDYASYIKRLSGKFFSGKYFVFGHSFGGRVAITMATKSPNNIFGLILCAPGGFSRGNFIKRSTFFVLAKIGKLLNFWPAAAFIFRKILYKLSRERDYFNASGVMKETMKLIIAENLRPKAKALSLPTLLLWGRKDRIVPLSDALYLKKNMQSIDCIFYSNQGHRLPYEIPQILAKEIDKWYKSQI